MLTELTLLSSTVPPALAPLNLSVYSIKFMKISNGTII